MAITTRSVWCRYCRGHMLYAGPTPKHCPLCRRLLDPTTGVVFQPVVYDLNWMDRRLLRAAKIAAD